MSKKLDELRAKQAQEIAALEREEAIQEAVTAIAGEPAKIFVYPLYGRAGTITYGGNGRYRDEGDPLKPGAVADLLEKLPPVPMVRHKNGCVRFVSESFFDSEENKDKGGDVELIAPAILTADLGCTPDYGHMPTCAVKWFTEINGELWEINANLCAWEVFWWSFKGRDQRNAPRIITDTVLNFKQGWKANSYEDEYPAVHHQEHGDGIQRFDRIRYGRGTDHAGHKFAFYTGIYDLDPAHWLRRVAALDAVGE